MRTAILLVTTCCTVFAATLVVPNNQAAAPGNAPIQVGATPSRIQQVVGGGQFAQAITITGLRLRAAPGKGPVSFKYASNKISLSTTQAFPNTINGHALPSTTFDKNVGPDAVTGYNGPVTASSPGCAAPGPCPFDVTIQLTTPFSYDPNKGRLLVDIVGSATTGMPVGSLDGVAFPDSTNSSVAFLAGDPTGATGTLTLGGLVLGLDYVIAGNQLGGSFGYLISSASSIQSQAGGVGLMGIINLDGAGNVSGTYIFQTDANDPKGARTLTGTLSGTYSNNPDGTGAITLNPDSGGSLGLVMVIADGGQSMQLAVTSSNGVDMSNSAAGGLARAAAPVTLSGSFAFELNNSPIPAVTVGVATFDGAGNATVSFTSAGPGGNNPQPQVSNGNITGTYSVNADGSGTVNLGSNGTFAFVITDGGSGLLLLRTNGTTNSVSTGTARLQ